MTNSKRRVALQLIFCTEAAAHLDRMVYGVAVVHKEFTENLTLVAVSLSAKKHIAVEELEAFIADFSGFTCTIIQVPFRYVLTCSQDVRIITSSLGGTEDGEG